MINLFNIHKIADEHPEIREFRIANGRKIFDDFIWWLIDEKDEVSESLIDETINVGIEKINLIFGHLATRKIGPVRAGVEAIIQDLLEGLEFLTGKDLEETRILIYDLNEGLEFLD